MFLCRVRGNAGEIAELGLVNKKICGLFKN